jgi:hypothetical protein
MLLYVYELLRKEVVIFMGGGQGDPSNSVVCGMRAKGAGSDNVDGVVQLMGSPGS